jgi:hypothetical protein
MTRIALAVAVLAAIAVLGLSASAHAAGGTIEINQAVVTAAGGFPYKITSAGSYRLSGNLTPPTSTNAINVTAPNVTVDLNGFAIAGPGSSNDAVIGIDAAGIADVTVENGTVTGFGLGVQVGFFGIVRNLHADMNGNGIHAANNTLVEGCTANNATSTPTTGFGIYCAAACTITGNTTNGDPFAGIQCTGNFCNISGNTAIANGAFGIECLGSGCLISGNTIANSGIGIFASDKTSGYGGNILNNSTNVSGGSSIGNNLCGGSAC